ncbi:MAG: DUF4097 family beta strand repeat-containing protein [Rhodanobacter sp.]
MRKLAVVLLLLALPAAASAAECRYSAPRSANLDAIGLHNLLLNVGSDDVDIQGTPGLSRVEVRGTACASKAKFLEDLQISAKRDGADATVDTLTNRPFSIGIFGSRYAYLKLQIRVPTTLAVQIKSGSGDVKAQQLAALNFDAGSGDLMASGIAGALTLKLGSGDVDARQVGSVDLRSTGSGDVKVDGVNGDVHSGRSGSGDLSFSHVRGSVTVESTGSGDVTLNQVGHNVDVGSTGSGDVTANDVDGDFTVRSSGSGEIQHNRVKGKVSVPADD